MVCPSSWRTYSQKGSRFPPKFFLAARHLAQLFEYDPAELAARVGQIVRNV
jgi:hypothetical protein